VTCWRSLRVRLTLAFSLLAAITVGAAAAATILLLRAVILDQLDTVLLEEATTLASLAQLPDEQLSAAVREIGAELDLGEQKFVSVRRADGVVVTGGRRIPPRVGRSIFVGAEPRIFTAGEDNARFRVAVAPTPSGGRVVVGIHATRPVRLVQRSTWGIGLASAALSGLLGLGAWFLTGRATREIDRLAAEVATIEAGTLERRLSERRTVEVDRLVAVLNRVLTRLERSVGQMRRFSADAAHELRTPIAALRARLEVGLRRASGPVPREVVLDAIEETERLGRLAEDLLTLARLEGGAVSRAALDVPVRLDTVVDEVGTALASIAEEQGRPFRWEAPTELYVRGSEPLLKRVVLNLIDNAFRHTPPSARVVVRAERDGDRACLIVADEGAGIAADVLPHVFERFRHGPGRGIGLGLALVREIVERHGGTVSVASAPGAGTTARVLLPLAG
jgi:two-component system, OmpR family, sensor kinase